VSCRALKRFKNRSIIFERMVSPKISKNVGRKTKRIPSDQRWRKHEVEGHFNGCCCDEFLLRIAQGKRGFKRRRDKGASDSENFLASMSSFSPISAGLMRRFRIFRLPGSSQQLRKSACRNAVPITRFRMDFGDFHLASASFPAISKIMEPRYK